MKKYVYLVYTTPLKLEQTASHNYHISLIINAIQLHNTAKDQIEILFQ